MLTISYKWIFKCLYHFIWYFQKQLSAGATEVVEVMVIQRYPNQAEKHANPNIECSPYKWSFHWVIDNLEIF